MRFLLSLSLISVIRSTVASPLPGSGDDVNLFVDADAYSLFPDDSTGSPANYADSNLDQALLVDDMSSNTLDWTDPIDLAGVDGFCAADDEVQISGRLRARDGESCTSSGQTVNNYKMPDWLDILKKIGPFTTPDTETNQPPPIGPGSSSDGQECPDPYPRHLCCGAPSFDSMEIVDGVRFYTTMESCTSGTR